MSVSLIKMFDSSQNCSENLIRRNIINTWTVKERNMATVDTQHKQGSQYKLCKSF